MDLRKEMDVRVPYFPSDLCELQSLGHFWTQTTNSVIASCKDMFFFGMGCCRNKTYCPKNAQQFVSNWEDVGQNFALRSAKHRWAPGAAITRRGPIGAGSGCPLVIILNGFGMFWQFRRFLSKLGGQESAGRHKKHRNPTRIQTDLTDCDVHESNGRPQKKWAKWRGFDPQCLTQNALV